MFYTITSEACYANVVLMQQISLFWQFITTSFAFWIKADKRPQPNDARKLVSYWKRVTMLGYTLAVDRAHRQAE